MADVANPTPAFNPVAIDIARYWDAVLVETAGDKRQRFKMANTAADFDRRLTYLRRLPGHCRVALEPTGDYHRPIAHRLLTEGFEVVGINSVAQARYREAMFNSWDKNDPKVTFAFTRELLMLFRPEFVNEGVVPLRLLAVATAFSVLFALAPTYLKYRQRDRATYVTVACAAVAQGILLLLLVPRLGATGAAIAYTISMCGMYGVFALMANRELALLKACAELSVTLSRPGDPTRPSH